MAKIIDLKTRGEIVAFLPDTSRTRDEAIKALGEAIAHCEQLLEQMDQQSSRQPSGLAKERFAFEAFMLRLAPIIEECGEELRITANTSWIKLEGIATGHRVYVSKGKLSVNRVDSTLPPELIDGAVSPAVRNGLIASWLPADVPTVCHAIRLITSQDTTPLRKA